MMTRERLRQYQALKREIAYLDESIDRLQQQAAAVPTVIGKVTASQREHPYIETHPLVMMDEPVAADAIARRICLRLRRRAECGMLLTEIESFINSIPDSTDRQIFEMIFLEGRKHWEVAEKIGYSRSRITQKISENLKD